MTIKNQENLVDWGTAENSNRYQVHALHINKENKLIYLIAVICLGASILISIIGISILAYFGKEIPAPLIAISSVAIGALGGLFTRN